jgi:hypothetical protein
LWGAFYLLYNKLQIYVYIKYYTNKRKVFNMSNNPSTVIKITQATAGSSPWYRLSTEMKDIGSFTGTLTSGDSVVVELSNDTALDASYDFNSATSSGNTTQKATSDSFTATSYSGSFFGPWKYARLTKTGSTGSATLYIK